MWNLFFRAALLALVSGYPLLANAQTAFVTDKVVIDIFADQTPQSEIVKSLPSGAIVEILALEGTYTKIQTTDKFIGWIESKYLTNEKPTQLEYLQLVSKYNSLNEKLKDYQTRLLTMQELRKEAQSAEWLREKLNDAKESKKHLEQSLKNKDIVITDLRVTVKNINQDLDDIKLPLNARLESSNTPENDLKDHSNEPLQNNINPPENLYTWLILSLIVTLAIGVLLGFVLIDYKVRKKHGGVRLY